MKVWCLNLGCGWDPQPGWVNIDYYPGEGVDMVMDLESAYLPYPNDSIDEIRAWHVFEHIHNFEKLAIECHRVLKPGGILDVRVPYMSFSAWHVRYFNKTMMCFFTDGWRNCKDFVPNAHNGRQPMPHFNLLDKENLPRRYYNYHFKKYLHLDWSIPWGIGELHWRFVKA